MSFDWAEYLSLAQQLCSRPVSGPPVGTEAQQRAGVSRAYYAAYIMARNHLRDNDGILVPPHAGSHHFVAAQYANDPDPVRANIGYWLSRLHAARNRCDYDDVVVNLPNLALWSLRRAAQVIADVARL
jgi:hypothetical protein